MVRWDKLIKVCEWGYSRTHMRSWGAPTKFMSNLPFRAPEHLVPRSVFEWLALMHFCFTRIYNSSPNEVGKDISSFLSFHHFHFFLLPLSLTFFLLYRHFSLPSGFFPLRAKEAMNEKKINIFLHNITFLSFTTFLPLKTPTQLVHNSYQKLSVNKVTFSPYLVVQKKHYRRLKLVIKYAVHNMRRHSLLCCDTGKISKY